ncbi:polysaccharide pyruvyl transferase family protein [Microbulbifer rhizosphaerae]|uniref:Polysaccharide pyruvyl transferase domain-containing protein n=1 Tax=Microbulbifer rhizosphaerae TaxID=1562603 RepID=A0A7W4ZCB2_9GAMM|nr:polysaccharide pyruvyl transferase family protein [Microbulbifer rhizosphaerae]MBB3063175.1 hypothetical protein [Microbulbifer rhizosphaerae]
MKITVISTFRRGKLNIGDHLITKATVEAVKKLYGSRAKINIIFRAENWAKVQPQIEDSDFIIFACLAIRKNLSATYRFLPQIIESGIPYGILSAGTSLNVSSSRLLLRKAFDEGDQNILRELASKSSFFTTRGLLTQAVCEDIGITNASPAGDIAFVDSRFEKRAFQKVGTVKKIAISDPHYADKYQNSFLYMLARICDIFPDAQVDLLLHGINDLTKKLASDMGIGIREIYLDSKNGLDVYDEYNLHVGYRVHGHVSALSRRKPSYLLEQDGRGCDYGLAISRKITVPNYKPMKVEKIDQAATTPVDILTSMIKIDSELEFSRFLGLESEIRNFSENNLKTLRTINNEGKDLFKRDIS